MPLEKSKFDLAIVIDEMIELIKLNSKKVRFVKKYSKGNKIFADINKIKQLVWNLASNSVKAVNYNGIVQISIYDENGHINLSIKDNGIGIEKKELSKIFIPFYSKFSSGIGLGMAVIKRIIEEHNFDIKINSKKNIGTEVIVCFKKI
jgi:signal transduction histidine kinase